MKTIFTFYLIILASFIYSQNVGIGTSIPSEKLEVEGLIFTNQGGLKFPDSTIQTTAAFNANPEDANDHRQFILLNLIIDGNPVAGDFTNESYTELIRIIGLDAQHSSPITLGTGGGGQITGAPQWNKFDIIKNIDKASVDMQKALFLNQDVNSAKFYFLVEGLVDPLETIYEIEIINGKVYDVSNHLVYQGNGTFAHMEKVSFIYSEIKFTYITDAGFEEFPHSFFNPR